MDRHLTVKAPAWPKLVDARDLHAFWPKVSIGLERVREGSGDTWIAEDVYAALSCGEARLYVGAEGFAVVQAIQQFDGRALLLWAANARSLDAEMHLAWARNLARALGCRRIVFHSARRGWERRSRDLGFERKYATYIMEL